jgi:signal transduction histidine kinase
VLEDIPQNYWQIRSGLGEAHPKYLVFIPLIFLGQAIGVIELATWKSVGSESLSLLENFADIFAVGLNAAESRQQLQTIYEKTLQQAEELQAQQEELRTNNEELEQQARAMESQQQNLNLKNKELETARYELERKAYDLSQSSKYKSEFLAKMSHELRTPLNGLLILSTLLIENKERTLSEKQLQFAQSIQNAGNDLLTLINDILDLSKIEARKLTIHPSEFTLGELFASKRRTFEPQTLAKKLTLVNDLDPELQELRVSTDRQRLDQILRNFISNALKFTEKGSITLSATHDPLRGQMTLSVADTGIGIPQDRQHLIFEAFEQGDTAVSGQFGGTGLGLTISKELAALLGGEISLVSKEHEGSRFSITLPIRISAQPVSSAPSALAATAPSPRTEMRPQIDSDMNADSILRETRAVLATVKPGAKTILIVEDDANFRSAVSMRSKATALSPWP